MAALPGRHCQGCAASRSSTSTTSSATQVRALLHKLAKHRSVALFSLNSWLTPQVGRRRRIVEVPVAAPGVLRRACCTVVLEVRETRKDTRHIFAFQSVYHGECSIPRGQPETTCAMLSHAGVRLCFLKAQEGNSHFLSHRSGVLPLLFGVDLTEVDAWCGLYRASLLTPFVVPLRSKFTC